MNGQEELSPVSILVRIYFVWHDVMLPAARFVHFARADDDDGIVVIGRLAVYETLGARGRLPADDADRVQFFNVFGLGHQERHRAKGFAAKIRVEPGKNDAHAARRQPVRDIGNRPIKKLRLVYRDDLRIRFCQFRNLLRVLDGNRDELGPVMRRDLGLAVTGIEPVRKDLDFLARDARAFHPSNQFFGLAAKHRAANDFDVPVEFVSLIHENR